MRKCVCLCWLHPIYDLGWTSSWTLIVCCLLSFSNNRRVCMCASVFSVTHATLCSPKPNLGLFSSILLSFIFLPWDGKKNGCCHLFNKCHTQSRTRKYTAQSSPGAFLCVRMCLYVCDRVLDIGLVSGGWETAAIRLLGPSWPLVSDIPLTTARENSRGRGRRGSGRKKKPRTPSALVQVGWPQRGGGVKADTYPLLSCVKPGWGSRAASGQTEREATTTIQTDRQSAQTRCPHLCRLDGHDVYNFPLTFCVIFTSIYFISLSSPQQMFGL